jgi:hypothetical protein
MIRRDALVLRSRRPPPSSCFATRNCGRRPTELNITSPEASELRETEAAHDRRHVERLVRIATDDIHKRPYLLGIQPHRLSGLHRATVPGDRQREASAR